jgi:hypothetical protein
MSFFIFYFLLFQTRTCYFHFLKALRKHLGDCHILPLLATNTQFASFVHLIYSLPYVPTANVIDVYEDVILKSLARIKKSTHPDIVANIGNICKWVDYLERTWIGREEKESSKKSGGREEKESSKKSRGREEKESSKKSGGREEKESSKKSGRREEKESSKKSGGQEEKESSKKTGGREEKESSKKSGRREEKESSKKSRGQEEKESSKTSGGQEEKESSKTSEGQEEKESSKTSGGPEKESSKTTAVEEEKVTRTAGLYPLYKWNQYEAAVEMWPRTNNSSEGNYGFCIFLLLEHLIYIF